MAEACESFIEAYPSASWQSSSPFTATEDRLTGTTVQQLTGPLIMTLAKAFKKLAFKCC